MAEHTKTPWTVDGLEHPGIVTIYAAEECIASVGNGEPWPEAAPKWKANAELIVSAVNEREAMLECEKALREARDTILHLKNSRWSEAEGSDEDWVSDIDAALSKLDEVRE